MSTARLVLVDRDGVINRDSDAYIKTADEWEALPGSLDAIARLTRAGFDVVVITNQSGIARGLFTEEALAAIHARMRQEVEAANGRIAAIYVCPHHPDDGCECRKPEPKLLLDAVADFRASPDCVAFIGDKASDVDAAKAAGLIPILVGDREPADFEGAARRFTDLPAAADFLIAGKAV